MEATAAEDSALYLAGRSILSFSLETWDDVWRSRHQIMSRLAAQNKVLFASAPYYVRDALRGPWRRSAYPSAESCTPQNLYPYVPPRWLPTNYRYPRLDRAMEQLRCEGMRRIMRKRAMSHPILYVWHPSFANMVGQFDEALVVYHCYDEFRSFRAAPGDIDRLIEQETRLLKRADIAFAVSDAVRARRVPLNPNIHVVRSGVDYQLFSKAGLSDTVIPQDLARIRHPIIGCVATQTADMDIALLNQIFQERPDWSFVFIGIERGPDHLVGPELRAFQNLPNVHFIGRRSLQEIPAYLKGCDVCTIPWLVSDITESGSPLKLYEYLATGKPVVSVRLRHLLHLQPTVSFATGPEEWIHTIEQALYGNDPAKIKERQDIAAQNTWDERVAFISQKLADELTKH